jgi:pimeloyl-ACP methyl ester carboxylesterase
VLCSPIGDDDLRAHRPIRHLAERLAARGFDVLRFDFHGTGDSSGDERAADRATVWRRDVGTAIDELRRRSAVGAVALVGLRFGGTLAAVAAADRGDVASLVLWSPFPDGRAFVDDALRTHQLVRMLDPAGFSSGPKTRADGNEALGFFLTTANRDGLRTVDLEGLTRPPARAALVIHTGGPSAHEQRLVGQLGRLGVQCTYRELQGHKVLETANHKAVVPDEVIDSVVSWLSDLHARVLEAPPLASSEAPVECASVASADDGADEEPVVFGEGHRLFGILVRPPRSRVSAVRPAILMLNAGTVRRVGPHRFYVPMARRWADLGFFVLRLDLSGIGDSSAPEGSMENLCYPPELARDVDAAMGAVGAATGASRFVLCGLCSGGDIAFLLGGSDPRVAGTVMLNPRTFMVNDLAQVTKYQQARHYQEALFRGASWVKLLHGDVEIIPRATRTLVPKLKGVLAHRLGHVFRSLGQMVDARGGAVDVPARLRSMVERGVDTFLVVSEHDPGVDYVDAHFGDAMRMLRSLTGFRREDIPGSDHTFTSRWSQERVSDLVTSHLVERHGG